MTVFYIFKKDGKTLCVSENRINEYFDEDITHIDNLYELEEKYGVIDKFSKDYYSYYFSDTHTINKNTKLIWHRGRVCGEEENYYKSLYTANENRKFNVVKKILNKYKKKYDIDIENISFDDANGDFIKLENNDNNNATVIKSFMNNIKANDSGKYAVDVYFDNTVDSYYFYFIDEVVI